MIWKLISQQTTRVEVRTIDTAQGHEADVVFVDFVRDTATTFLDDPNRICVAITRARQAEVLVMHPGLRVTTTGTYSRFLKPILDSYEKMGQIARLGRANPAHQLVTTQDEALDIAALDRQTLAAAADWISQKPLSATGQAVRTSNELLVEVNDPGDIKTRLSDDKGAKALAAAAPRHNMSPPSRIPLSQTSAATSRRASSGGNGAPAVRLSKSLGTRLSQLKPKLSTLRKTRTRV